MATKSKASKAAKKSSTTTKKSSKTKKAKSSKAKKAASAGKQAGEISAEQWDLPASFNAEGTQMATLREVVNPEVPTLSLAELSPDQRADLVAKRIEAQPKFQLAMVGAGIIDKERAIAEVKAKTKIGRALCEIEQRVINNLLNKAKKY
jgi:hypothetical protein